MLVSAVFCSFSEVMCVTFRSRKGCQGCARNTGKEASKSTNMELVENSTGRLGKEIYDKQACVQKIAEKSRELVLRSVLYVS